jgi:hypothetical protein
VRRSKRHSAQYRIVAWRTYVGHDKKEHATMNLHSDEIEPLMHPWRSACEGFQSGSATIPHRHFLICRPLQAGIHAAHFLSLREIAGCMFYCKAEIAIFNISDMY